jgi:hypothetical protein
MLSEEILTKTKCSYFLKILLCSHSFRNVVFVQYFRGIRGFRGLVGRFFLRRYELFM